MFRSLSARLLLFTILFVMIAEVLIFVPSVANFRKTWLQQRLDAAQLAALALEAAPNNAVGSQLERELLANAGVIAVVLKRSASSHLILSDRFPPSIANSYDLREATMLDLMVDALSTLGGQRSAWIQAVGAPKEMGGDYIAIILDQADLRAAMWTYGRNILVISIIISLITALLLYISLLYIFVRPMRRLMRSMTRFGADPEDPANVIQPRARRDEFGGAELALRGLQDEVRSALAQKARLADLGTAVAKINHDLRNLLSTAQLMSDRLEESPDPQVRRTAPALVGAINRAIALCTATLSFGKSEPLTARPVPFELDLLLADLGNALGLRQRPDIQLTIEAPEGLEIEADPDLVYRALQNLGRNAVEAMSSGGRLCFCARYGADSVEIEVRDTGPGLPEAAKKHLFQPFRASSKQGGTGLGLANVRDIMQAHGGAVRLQDTGPSGTAFLLIFPQMRTDIVAAHNKSDYPEPRRISG